ncbi:MAG: T9SS type A sorting domain-containing protein [Ignavibacteria bacterium]|nr:T9SS type A sorting domain-containing protein [Ignavibacteria bacterium]
MLLIPVAAIPLFSQPLIINELYNSSTADEWVELVVVQSGLDIRGWDLRDFTSGGAPQDPLEFLSVPLWSDLPAGTVVLIAKPDALFDEDLDPSDYLLIVKADNEEYLDGTLFLFAGTSDAIQIRDSSGGHQFGVSWGSGNAGSLPEPRMHFDNASASNTSASFDGGSLGVLGDSAGWTRNNTAPTPGEGNGKQNSALIDSLRGIVASVGSGSGFPHTFLLKQNYPNPFNSISNFGFEISDLSDVSLRIYDLSGREVATIVDERLASGNYSRKWDARGVTSGVYLYRLTVDGQVLARKMILLK